MTRLGLLPLILWLALGQAALAQSSGFGNAQDVKKPVEVTADSVRAGGDLGGTERQCLVAGAPLAQLLAGSSYVVEGERLTLTRGRTSLVFRAD